MVMQENEQAALMTALKNERRLTEMQTDNSAANQDQDDMIVGTSDPMFDDLDGLRVNHLINTSEIEQQRKGSWGQRMDTMKSPNS